VEHWFFMKPLHLVLCKAILFASFHLIQTFCSSLSIVPFQVVLGLPLFLVLGT
jgi:hypothetical protein